MNTGQIEMPFLPKIRRRRTFTATWDESAVVVVDPLKPAASAFFERVKEDAGPSGVRYMFHPEGISYEDMLVFRGKKTRVTIEIVD